MTSPVVEWLGDCALLLRFGNRIDAALNAHVHAAARALHAAQLPGIVDIVPAYASIALRYDPLVWRDDRLALAPGQRLAARLQALAWPAPESTGADAEAVAIDIPVCYGGDFGPDLAEIARHTGLDPEAVIAGHAAGRYHVAMLGFAPGFPYLLGLDAALHTPRRAHPRTRVPAGSVAIGGAQTGIYPRELPGGWQIIGRTPRRLFDASAPSPALLTPGQPVRFRAIDADEFQRLSP